MATQHQRPLSPHLQVYRLPLTALLSITHRMTGVFLSFGLLVLTYWLSAAAAGPEAFKTAQGFVGSWIGLLILLGFSFALFFHLCNGIRHLFWDTGRGLSKESSASTAWLVIFAAAGLTVLVWGVGLVMGGGA